MTAPAETTERRSAFSGFVIFTSEIVAVGTTINLEGINPSKPHCFVGAQFFADSEGLASATPGAGTIAVTAMTLNNDPNFEDLPSDDGTAAFIDATAPTTLSWAANTLEVKAIPSSITTATHWRIVVTCNET